MEIIVALIGAGATIAAAVIGLKSGKKAGRKEKEKEIDDAPRKYVDHLDRLIQEAIREGGDKAVLNARAIVSVRNDLRNSMLNISERLNSDIDRLAEEIGEAKESPRFNRREAASPAVIFETIQVLSKKWPAKKDQVEIELRKVLAELGLTGRAPAQAHDEDRFIPPPTAAPPEGRQRRTA